MKPMTQKRIEAIVEAAFIKHSFGLQFDIMDLGKIFNAGTAAVKAGEDLDAAMLAAIAKYQQN